MTYQTAGLSGVQAHCVNRQNVNIATTNLPDTSLR